MRPVRTIPAAAIVSAALAFASCAQAGVQISTDPTKNMHCSGGICSPTKKNAVLNVGDLQTMLAASDVTVTAGHHADAINVLAPLTWTSAQRLALDAVTSIHVRAPVVVEGPGALTLITNDGGTGGDYSFSAGGYAAFWDLSSSLIINGAGFTLVKDIATLASDIANNPSGNFALATSYDASVDGAYDHVPIATVFMGSFDGMGNTISNLSIALPSQIGQLVGLFAQSGGSLRDIALTNVNYSAQNIGNTINSGALAGENDGTVSHASASGLEGAGLSSGGLIGVNKGPVAYCSSSVAGTLGGLVSVNSSSITQSFSTANTSGIDAGGLVNLNDGNGSITLSYATGNATGATVVSGYGNAGGLAGINDGAITQSFATGTVTAANGKLTKAGGLVGYLGNGSLVLQSYATGQVIGGRKSDIGGLVGEVDTKAAIQQSYSTGAVTIGKSNFAGGALGYDKSAGRLIAALDWDLDTSGITDPGRGAGAPRNDPGITGLTDAQLKSGLPAGFDPNVWGQNASINNGWPYLLANPPQ